MHLKRVLSILIVILLLFGMVGCDYTDKAYIYFQLFDKPQTVDPQTASTDTELLIVNNIFEGLFRKDKDGKIVNGVIESYKKNGLTYTFKLKKDLIWSDETPLTAHDFVFGFKRAVMPETKSPFVTRLFAIENAKEIFEGKADYSTLGVIASDDYTLKIQLIQEDDKFKETLTTSVCMPCNEKFFYESGGKYGIESETTLSNGSYKLSKWGKEIFGIRLYKNKNYVGDFTAKNAAVFLSFSEDKTVTQILAEDDADMAFIPPVDIETVKEIGFNIKSHDNICWFLTLSDRLPLEIRKSFSMLADGSVYEKSLKTGYSVANSIYPPALNTQVNITGMPIYDLEKAKQLYSQSVVTLPDKKFPSDIVLYYYDDSFSKKVVTDIVGHWQNNLGAFVNIEAVSSADILTQQLKEQSYGMSIFPIDASSPELAEYLQKFGINYDGQDLTELQIQVLKSNNIVPIMYQSTCIAYEDGLNNVVFTHGNGCIDFSFIIKKS